MAEKYVEKIKSASSGEVYTIRDANAALASDLTTHTNNSGIHVTAAKKSEWDAKQDALPDTTGKEGKYLKVNNEGNLAWAEGGGSGGTSDYTDLDNKPKINNVELAGNKSAEDLGLLNSSDVGSMAAEDKNDYFTKTEVTDGFLSTNQGSENADKFLKVDTYGNVICDDFDVNPQDIENAVSDYLDEHPVTVVTDTEISATSTNPLQNKAIYDSLYEPSEIPYDSTTETKKAISSTDGSIIAVAANSYIVNIYNNIDPTQTYWIDAYAYGSDYAYCGFYKIENEIEVCLGLVQFKSAAQRRIQDELLTVPADTTIIKVAGQTTANYASLKTRYASIDLLKDRCSSLETRTDDLETLTHTLDLRTNVLNTVDVATDDTIINEMFTVTYPRTLTKDDFTVVGYYNNTDSTMKTQYAYHSVPLIPVKPGQMVYWHNWILPAYAQACCLYDNDGLPYNGTNARKDYNALTTHDTTTGEFSLLIPEGCTQIGFSLADSAFSGLEGTIVASELSYNFSDNAVDQIEDIIQTTPVTVQPTGLDYGVYYQRGAYGKSFDYSKKLCILAGGQSNAAGRAPFVRFPFDLCGESGTPTSPFTLPNVQYLGATEDFGTSANAFANATITKKNEDETKDNSWAFDSVTYACMTNASYGNQTDIHVVKRAVGGTSIDVEGATNMHWTADYKDLTGSNSLLRALEGYIRTAETLQSTGYEIRAMVWHQGEGDATTQGPASRYYANFKKMITYIRGIVGNPFLPFYCGTISNNNHADAYKDVVNNAMNQIAAEDQYVRVVDMSGAVLEDSWHFDYKACIYFGKAVYNMMLEDGIIQNGTPIDNPLPDNWTSNS